MLDATTVGVAVLTSKRKRLFMVDWSTEEVLTVVNMPRGAELWRGQFCMIKNGDTVFHCEQGGAEMYLTVVHL